MCFYIYFLFLNMAIVLMSSGFNEIFFKKWMQLCCCHDHDILKIEQSLSFLYIEANHVFYSCSSFHEINKKIKKIISFLINLK